jgi:hypothetical protein
MQLDTTLGMETVGRAFVLICAEGLEDELDYQQAAWDTADQEFAARLGRTYEQTKVEPIPLAHMHYGHIPNLIDSEIFDFPNLAAMTFSAQPSGDQSSDMYNQVTDTVFIEVMCRSGPYSDNDAVSRERGQDLVNMRTTRTVEAIVSLINKHPTLDGVLASPIPRPPSVEIFDVFKRHEDRERGPLWFWQGARMEYRVDVYSQIYY